MNRTLRIKNCMTTMMRILGISLLYYLEEAIKTNHVHPSIAISLTLSLSLFFFLSPHTHNVKPGDPKLVRNVAARVVSSETEKKNSGGRLDVPMFYVYNIMCYYNIVSRRLRGNILCVRVYRKRSVCLPLPILYNT